MKSVKDLIHLLEPYRDETDKWAFEHWRFVLAPFGAIQMISALSDYESTLVHNGVYGSMWWTASIGGTFDKNDPAGFPWFGDYEKTLVYQLPGEDCDKGVLMGKGELLRYDNNEFLMQYSFPDNQSPVSTIHETRPCFSIVAMYDLAGWDLRLNKDGFSGTATHELFPHYKLEFKWDKENHEFDFKLIREYKRCPGKPTVRSWSNKSLTASLEGMTRDIPCYRSVDDQNEV